MIYEYGSRFFFFPASPIREELPLLSPQTNDATNTSSKNQEKGIQVADTKSNKRAVKQKKKKRRLLEEKGKSDTTSMIHPIIDWVLPYKPTINKHICILTNLLSSVNKR